MRLVLAALLLGSTTLCANATERPKACFDVAIVGDLVGQALAQPQPSDQERESLRGPQVLPDSLYQDRFDVRRTVAGKVGGSQVEVLSWRHAWINAERGRRFSLALRARPDGRYEAAEMRMLGDGPSGDERPSLPLCPTRPF